MPRSNKSGKIYIIIGSTLILIGVIGVLFPYLPFRLSADVAYLDDLAESVVENPASSSNSFSPTPTPKPLDPNRPSVKNRLVVSGASVNMPIYQSKNADVLAKGGWIFPGTSTPNSGSNTVIFGHRFRYLPPISNMFYHLDLVKAGDEFQISWQGIAYRYCALAEPHLARIRE